MDTYTGFSGVYQNQPNMYYQPTSTQPIYTQRNWQSYYQVPSVMNQQSQYAQPQQSMNSSMVWVQGESGAKAYALPNNTTLPLWDSEDQVIYIKSVDANGKPSMTILTYTEHDDNHVDTQHEEYATKQQIESINEKFNEINEKLAVMGKYVNGGYSQRRMPIYYDGGNSYDNNYRGGRNMSPYYSRRSMGYSYDGSKDHMIEKLNHLMMESNDQHDKEAIQRLIDQMENK